MTCAASLAPWPPLLQLDRELTGAVLEKRRLVSLGSRSAAGHLGRSGQGAANRAIGGGTYGLLGRIRWVLVHGMSYALVCVPEALT